MLRLLIADDEKYDRDSIVAILGVEFKKQLEVYEAKNGREAIEISEKVRPDIIIMDIKMPGINGLKAIQEIKKFLPNSYFIILTAYDYFDFAVEAVKNNVREYILKPFSATELIEKIRDGINYVNNEKEKRRNEIENQEKLYNLMPILENELSYAIINNSIQSIDCDTYMKYLNIEFKNACSIVIQLKEERENEGTKLQIAEYIKEYISRRYKNIASYRFTKNLIYFVQVRDYEDESEPKISIFNLATDIRRELKRLFNVCVNIGIGRCYKGLDSVHRSYEEACSCLEYISPNADIVHFEDINNSFAEKESSNEKLQNMDRGKIALFNEVEQYILDNLKEDIELERTAAKFNLSPYYFSRTFKEVIGYNFSDYINIVRISKAKELLKSDYTSVKEVCYSVGYSDPNYFSKVFKKYVGISPTEFKAKPI